MFINIFFFLLFFFSVQSWGFKSRNTHSVPSSTSQMCDSSYLNHEFSVFRLFQILLVLSLLIYLLLQHSSFHNHHVFSYLLLLSLNCLSHFLNYYTSQTSQLLWGLIILPTSIFYGQKTPQDCIFGPNTNLYCLCLG